MRLASSAALLMVVLATAAQAQFRYHVDSYEEAVAAGDAAATKAALAKGSSPDRFAMLSGGTPLSVAVLKGHLSVVKVLVAAKANLDSPDHANRLPPGWTLRCAAALHGKELQALVARAKSGTTESCLAEVRFIMAATRGALPAIKAAQFPEGLSLEAAQLALAGAVAPVKPEVAKAVIEASGNPRLPHHTGLVFHRDKAMQAVLDPRAAE